MPNVRMLPPSDGAHASIVIHGRTYTTALAAFADMPDHDAVVAAGNGWTPVLGMTGGMSAQVGATAARPKHPTGDPRAARGQVFIDTTLGAVIVYDGTVWRNVLTGAAV